MLRSFASLVAVSFLWLLNVPECRAAIVWDGPAITFAKLGFEDWTLPENQDRITPLVSLTRGNTQGLFNIASEAFFAHQLSPAGTEWAYGTTADFATLTYKNWDAWVANNPPATVGRNAVLHLVQEDIYLNITFTSWGGSPSGGAFSYERSTIPEPSGLALLGVNAIIVSVRRRR